MDVAVVEVRAVAENVLLLVRITSNMDKKDALGDILPKGYKQWQCDKCGACCNFEAMMFCHATMAEHPNLECGFDRDQPESNSGCFAFIVKEKPIVLA